jgi:hypothetical protein
MLSKAIRCTPTRQGIPSALGGDTLPEMRWRRSSRVGRAQRAPTRVGTDHVARRHASPNRCPSPLGLKSGRTIPDRRGGMPHGLEPRLDVHAIDRGPTLAADQPERASGTALGAGYSTRTGSYREAADSSTRRPTWASAVSTRPPVPSPVEHSARALECMSDNHPHVAEVHRGLTGHRGTPRVRVGDVPDVAGHPVPARAGGGMSPRGRPVRRTRHRSAW